MEVQPRGQWAAFDGVSCLATGEPGDVARRTKEAVDRGVDGPVLVIDEATGEQVDVDFRGTVEEVVGRIVSPEPAQPPRGPGRPRLGVVAREVTLLPRHWEWLNSQPGGASVALRKLVEEASRANAEKDRVRKAREASYRFMTALAGNFPGFEEALRALFAGNGRRFEQETEAWPVDVRDHARRLAAPGLSGSSG